MKNGVVKRFLATWVWCSLLQYFLSSGCVLVAAETAQPVAAQNASAPAVQQAVPEVKKKNVSL